MSLGNRRSSLRPAARLRAVLLFDSGGEASKSPRGVLVDSCVDPDKDEGAAVDCCVVCGGCTGLDTITTVPGPAPPPLSFIFRFSRFCKVLEVCRSSSAKPDLTYQKWTNGRMYIDFSELWFSSTLIEGQSTNYKLQGCSFSLTLDAAISSERRATAALSSWEAIDGDVTPLIFDIIS